MDTNPNTTLFSLYKLVHNFSFPLFFHLLLSIPRLTSRIGHSVNTPKPRWLQQKAQKQTSRSMNNMVVVKMKTQKPPNWYSKCTNVVPPPIQLKRAIWSQDADAGAVPSFNLHCNPTDSNSCGMS